MPESDQPKAAGPDGERTPTFSESFTQALWRSGIGQVKPGEVPTAGSLLKAIGGVRGLIESILPGLVFLVLYTVTANLVLSVLVPVAIALVFVVIRLATRTPLTQAFAGVIGIVVSAVLALVTGKAVDNFIPGMVINAVCVTALLVSILVRWPIIGIVVGFLTNEGTAWRKDRAKRRVLYVATWLWVGLFALRLAVEVPLYLAGEVAWLAGTKLLLGVPLYAALLWVTWLLVRAVYGRAAAAAAAHN